MKIGILSFQFIGSSSAKEEIRLKKAIVERGHKARIIRAQRCQLLFDQDELKVLYDAKQFPKFDLILARPTILRNLALNTSIIKQLELMGIPVMNSAESVLQGKNKLLTMQILMHNKIPIARTVVVNDVERIDEAIEQVGGLPIILKSAFGSYGSGVVLIESKRSLMSGIGVIWRGYGTRQILIQEFIKESKGEDIRAFVVGDKVITSMMRQPKHGEFRSNIELGGTGIPVKITQEEADLAIRATKVLGLEYGGVDILRSNKGPVILEVNANPGFKAIEAVTGVDIAGAIVDHALEWHKRFL